MKKSTAILLALVALVFGLSVSGTLTGAEKETVKSEYVGSAKCMACHKIPYDSWKLTYHSKMVRSKADGILKDAVEKWKTDGYNEGPTKGNVTGKAAGIDDVRLVLGSKWKQRYLVKNELSGGYQFLDKQFNRISGRWENYGQKNDWDSMCVTCHTTGYRLTQYDPGNPKAQKGEFSELNIGCESCHGPGTRHITSKSKKDIWNFAGKTKEEQSRVCGYCHIRLDNHKYKSAQGNDREDFPAPKVGQSFMPSDDWRKWYPDSVVIPGVHASRPFNAEYKGDLKGLFIVDALSKANGVYEEAKHHQEYQGFIQSKHYRTAGMGCMDCHSPHATNTMARKDPQKVCVQCHDASYTHTRYMPGTGKTADNLFVRSHTFVKDQKRPNLPTYKGEPEYYK